MLKNYYVPTLILGAVTSVIIQTLPGNALSTEQIGDIAEQITVRILTPGSPGSGIIIGKNGDTYKVLTALHVVQSINPGEESDVQTFDGEFHSLNSSKIQTFGDNWDLAVIEFTSTKSYQVGKLGDSSTLKRGKTVYVAGFPIATAAINIPILTFTSGNLTAVASTPFNDGYGLVYDNNTLPGMSGGVVLDEDGNIVGVHGRADSENTQATDDPTIRVKTGFNLAIPINYYLTLSNQITGTSDTSLVKSSVTADDYYIQGNQELKKSNYQEAISLYTQAIKLNPQYADAFNNRAIAYYNLPKYPEAIADFTQAIQLKPQYTDAYNNRAIAYYDSKKYPEAIADYTKAIEIDPQYADAYYNRANTYYDWKKYPEAIADYSKAIELNSQDTGAYNNRGNAYHNLKQYPEAIGDYTKAIELNPQYALAYNNRGNTYYNLKQYPEAIANYTKAIELNPQYALAYNNRGNTYYKLQRYQEAIADYTKAVQINPNLASAYSNLGNIYYNLQQYPEAIADYTKAIELNPQDSLAYNNRGNTYYVLQRYQEAIADYTKAIELNPQDGYAYYGRGNSYYSLKQYSETKRDLEQAANLLQQKGDSYWYQKAIEFLELLPK